MKLIYCPLCQDVVKLHFKERKCECGRASGYYRQDGLHTIINSDALPLGFANSSLQEAIKNRPKAGWGERFEAFVIPEECDTIEVEGQPSTTNHKRERIC